MRIRSAGLVTGLGLLLGVLAGCSKDDTAEVSGVVKVDGTPAEKGSISFFAVNGTAPTAGAEIKAGGKYTAKVPYGMTKVEVRIPKVVGKKKLYDTPQSPVQDVLAESLPVKYNTKTELTYDSKPGQHEQNWDLTTK